jgi:hypothetical protein
MPENFPAGQLLRKANKCFDVCIVILFNYAMPQPMRKESQ